MCDVISKYAVLQMVEAAGLCRFVFRKTGYDIDRGIILVVDNSWQAGQIADALQDATDAKVVESWSKKTCVPLNYQMGVMVYQKTCKVEQVITFLLQKDFLPVVIVAGMIPAKILGSGYPFRLDLTALEIVEYGKMYEHMRATVVEHIETFVYELKHFKTSHVLNECCFQDEYSYVARIIFATAVAWKMAIREINDEKTTEKWCAEYCSLLIDKLNDMDDFGGQYVVEEAVKKCIFSYVKEKNVRIGDLHDDQFDNKSIFSNANFYYFPEALLKDICRPLTNTVSFLQLKSEMDCDGMLECNDVCRQNYTVKVTCYDGEKDKYVRKRFLKLRKDRLLTDEGMTLEDWLELELSKDEEENADVY